jgi:hypothetical protein
MNAAASRPETGVREFGTGRFVDRGAPNRFRRPAHHKCGFVPGALAPGTAPPTPTSRTANLMRAGDAQLVRLRRWSHRR